MSEFRPNLSPHGETPFHHPTMRRATAKALRKLSVTTVPPSGGWEFEVKSMFYWFWHTKTDFKYACIWANYYNSELRGFWGDSLTRPPFGVTSAEVAIICPDAYSKIKFQHLVKCFFGRIGPFDLPKDM